MWTRDWLRRIRSGKIVSVELTGRVDAAIANRQSTLEDADVKIVTYDDDNDFVVVSANHYKQLSTNTASNSANASRIDATSRESCSQGDSQQVIGDCEEYFISRTNAHSMELCGRRDHNHTFQDLRSASQAIKRDENTRQKYYNFKHVKPGDVGAPCCQSVEISDPDCEVPSTEYHSILTKSELYRQAQLPPRPPKYHRRHIDKMYGTLSQRVDARREARKHGKAIMEGHLEGLVTLTYDD